MLLKIAIIEDNEMYANVLKQAIQGEGIIADIYESGSAFLDHIDNDYSMVSVDYSLDGENGVDLIKKIYETKPKLPVILLSGQDDVSVVVEAYELGVAQYIIKDEVAITKLKHAIANVAEKLRMTEELELLREEIPDRTKYKKIIGESTAILNVLKLINRVEKTDAMVMITGSSGTGKEVVAKTIHYNSTRRGKPYVAINMAAIPEDIMEDELFGHERGAFTGASAKRKGKFEEADGGTIFLDEIGEISLNLQVRLLRVLQEKKVTRLGSNKEISLDIRVIAATNKNLAKLVKKGLFREDLYYRVQGFLIHLPDLKDRGNDVKVLARHFVKVFAEKNNSGEIELDEGALEKLSQHDWTGNVRELMSVIERAMLMCSGKVIRDRDLVFSDMI